jgi:hypothetical protein
MKDSSVELAHSSRLPIQMGQSVSQANSITRLVLMSQLVITLMNTSLECWRRLGYVTDHHWATLRSVTRSAIGPAWKARRPCPNRVVVLRSRPGIKAPPTLLSSTGIVQYVLHAVHFYWTIFAINTTSRECFNSLCPETTCEYKDGGRSVIRTIPRLSERDGGGRETVYWPPSLRFDWGKGKRARTRIQNMLMRIPDRTDHGRGHVGSGQGPSVVSTRWLYRQIPVRIRIIRICEDERKYCYP